MSASVISLDDFKRSVSKSKKDGKQRYTCLILCVPCKNKWVGNVLSSTNIFRIICPSCKKANSFVSFLPPQYMEEIMNKGKK